MDEDLIIAAYSAEAVEKAKEVSIKCPVGFLICLDHESGKVYYKDTNSENTIIPTDFTARHINIAYYDFPPLYPHHIAWDEFNSVVLAKGKRDWYKAKEK